MITCFKMAFSTISQLISNKSNYRYLKFITGILGLKSLQISQPLLNNLKVQILVRKHKFGKASNLILDCMISQVSCGL